MNETEISLLGRYAKMVAGMRDKQNQYFRQRTPENLRIAKAAEWVVDHATSDILDSLLPSQEPDQDR